MQSLINFADPFILYVTPSWWQLIKALCFVISLPDTVGLHCMPWYFDPFFTARLV